MPKHQNQEKSLEDFCWFQEEYEASWEKWKQKYVNVMVASMSTNMCTDMEGDRLVQLLNVPFSSQPIVVPDPGSAL